MKRILKPLALLTIGATLLFTACNLFQKKPELEVEFTIELSADYIITSLAKDKNHPLLTKVIALANEAKNDQEESFINLFGKAFEMVNPDQMLAEMFNINRLSETSNSLSGQETLEALQKELDLKVEQTKSVLQKRINQFGLRNQRVVQIGNTERILIEIPRVDNLERFKEFIQTRAMLAFWETYDNREVFDYLEQANEEIRNVLTKREIIIQGKPFMPTDYIIDTTSAKESNWVNKYPLFAVLKPRINQEGLLLPGPCIGNVKDRDTSTVYNLLSLPEVKNILPKNLKFSWTIMPASWDTSNSIYDLIAIKATTLDSSPPLDGTFITRAYTETDLQGDAYITITKNAEGARIWQRLTADNIGRAIAITLDNRVYSYPQVNAEIQGGRSSISGDFTKQQAQDLAKLLQAGAFPTPVSIIDYKVKNDSLDEN